MHVRVNDVRLVHTHIRDKTGLHLLLIHSIPVDVSEVGRGLHVR